MTRKTLTFGEGFYPYFFDHFIKEPLILKELRLLTQGMRGKEMQISPELGQFLQFIISFHKVETILEIGTFTGYSALAMALALPEKGHLTTLNLDRSFLSVAEQYWQKADVAHKISLIRGGAQQSMETMAAQNHKFDFIFIDGDKESYPTYYNLSLDLLNPEGLIAIDNVFWKGKISNPSDQDFLTCVMRDFNTMIKNDSRIKACTLPFGDGVTLVCKKR